MYVRLLMLKDGASETYRAMQNADRYFLRRDQLSGSSGEVEGAGTRTMSCSDPLPCFVCMSPWESTRWTVPGMTSTSSVAAVFGC